MNALDLALDYIGRGWNPVPVPFREKKPLDDDWQKRIIDAAAAPAHFNGNPMNVGVQLGANSHNLNDVDLDCHEAIVMAAYILPPTKAIFGRASKRNSHRLYYSDLPTRIDKAVYQFHDPNTGEMLLELRIGGCGKGAQTVFPGSTHESGEPIKWETDGEVAAVAGNDLYRLACELAAYCLIARYWPSAGSRHRGALVIGGFLSRVGKTPVELKLIMDAVAHAVVDEEWGDRLAAVKDAAEAYRAGKTAYGFPALAELIGRNIAEKVAEWLDYQGERHEEEPRADNANAALISARASSYEMTAVEWLWESRLAIGKLALIVGLPDEGKGQLLAYLAAQVTNGDEWPLDEGRALTGNVIIFSDEDDPNDTLVPRLAAAGAALDSVEIVKMVRTNDKERMFSLVTDLDALRRKIVEVGNVKLVLIDPISAYLGIGKIDSFRGTDVRAVLTPLITLAAEMRIAPIGVMHFNKKVDVTNALLRISDSLAFGAVARHVFGVIDDEENKRKLFVRAKNNAAARSQNKTLAFRFGTRQVGTDRQTGKEIWAPHILWDPQYVDVTAVEAMQAATDNKSPGARDAALRFLRETLSAGPVAKQDIEEAAEANCISASTLRRAKDTLGIIAKKSGLKGGWTWQLPEQQTHRNRSATED